MSPEFGRPVRADTLGETPQTLSLEADEAERAALARRFGLVAIARLTARAALRRTGVEIRARGTLSGAVTQRCVATGGPVEADVTAPFDLVFQPQPAGPARDEEIELGEGELDTIFYDGAAADIGEAVAQTLFLNLDPYPRAPDAEAALKAAGVKSEEEAGPFAALAALKDKLGQ